MGWRKLGCKRICYLVQPKNIKVDESRVKWLGEVVKGIRELGVNFWRCTAGDKENWRLTVEDSKTQLTGSNELVTSYR